MSQDPDHDYREGWVQERECWVLGECLMEDDGRVYREVWNPKAQGVDLLICWAPTSGMLRRRVKP